MHARADAVIVLLDHGPTWGLLPTGVEDRGGELIRAVGAWTSTRIDG